MICLSLCCAVHCLLETDIRTIDNLEGPPYVTPDEWLAQRPVLLGAETFAAICIAKCPGCGYSDYGLASLDWIADPTFDFPEDKGYKWAMYVPTCAVWMHLAAQRIYELCVKNRTQAGARIAWRSGTSADWV